MNRQNHKEILFMGKITGAIAHDMNNVLATIEMNSALIQDLFSLLPDSLLEKKDQIPRAFGIIDSQVNRGVELSNKLSAFAHITDEVENNVDLNDMVRQIASLSERFARLKQVNLKVVTRDHPLLLIQQPFIIQMALFFCLELILENLLEKDIMHAATGLCGAGKLCYGQAVARELRSHLFEDGIEGGVGE